MHGNIQFILFYYFSILSDQVPSPGGHHFMWTILCFLLDVYSYTEAGVQSLTTIIRIIYPACDIKDCEQYFVILTADFVIDAKNSSVGVIVRNSVICGQSKGGVGIVIHVLLYPNLGRTNIQLIPYINPHLRSGFMKIVPLLVVL